MKLKTKELGQIREWFERLNDLQRIKNCSLNKKCVKNYLTEDCYPLGRKIINTHGARLLKDRLK